MPLSPARIAAFDILLRVEEQNAYASELLHAPQYSKLSPADHRLATEIVMGVLRWRSWLDTRITKRSSIKLHKLDPEVLLSLRIAAYQLSFLTRVPEHAAIHESVELVKRSRKRSAASFVNALLRGFGHPAPGTPEQIDTAEALSESFAHPLWLVQRWTQEFGLETARQICSYDQRAPQTTISIADSKVEHELEEAGIELAPGNLLASARRVIKGDVTKTHAFREGRVAIQDEGSQLVALLAGHGTKILDCCAAPGGKTRILAKRNPSAAILAAELHPHRAVLLRELVPARNVHVVTADAIHLPTVCQFDLALADVPCSGTGTLARNPEIKWRLKPENLAEMQKLQIAILKSAMQRVAPRGRLLYSTCSLECEENEAVIEAVIAGSSFSIVDVRSRLDALCDEGELTWTKPDSLVRGPYLRTLPGLHPCDGFFAAMVENTGAS